MKLNYSILTALAGIILTGRPVIGAEVSNPMWLADCSVGIKESDDDNVFLSGVEPKYLPLVVAVPAGSVLALKIVLRGSRRFSPRWA
jgi:hypothetical protein